MVEGVSHSVAHKDIYLRLMKPIGKTLLTRSPYTHQTTGKTVMIAIQQFMIQEVVSSMIAKRKNSAQREIKVMIFVLEKRTQKRVAED